MVESGKKTEAGRRGPLLLVTIDLGGRGEWSSVSHTAQRDSVSVSCCVVVSLFTFIVEHVVARQFMDYADKKGVPPVRESAYQKYHLTESDVPGVRNNIVCAIDQGQVVALVLLDVSYTFYTADHPTLLSLIQDRFAVFHQSLAWFHSYLTNRTQTFTTASSQTSSLLRTQTFTTASSQTSSLLRTQTFTTASSQTSSLLLSSGVPQGSGLGPTSFLTYSEGTTNISARSLLYHLYATDTL